MKTFPMFLTMTGRRVVIVGGGEQAAQKCRLMLKTEAQIEVLADGLDVELQSLAHSGRITWSRAAITPAQFEGAALVFVATGCPGQDACLHMLAKAGGAVVNVVDQPDLCDAITPSIIDRDPVVVAIGTEGVAPVLGQRVKTLVEAGLEPALGDFLKGLRGLRPRMAERRLTPSARAFWNWQFLPGGAPDLPQTRAMLMRACDVRLPARLSRRDLDAVIEALLMAAQDVMGKPRAYGT